MEKLQLTNKNLENKISKLEKDNNNKQQMINDLMILNVSLQNKIILEFPKVQEKNEEIQVKVLSNFNELMRTYILYHI